MVLRSPMTRNEVRIGPLVDPATHAELVARIRSAATRLRYEVEQMWQAVDAVLGCT